MLSDSRLHGPIGAAQVRCLLFPRFFKPFLTPSLCFSSFSFIRFVSGNFDCFEVTEEEVRACRSIAAWISNQEGHLVWESKVGNSEELFFVKAQGRTKYELCFECNTDTDHTDAVNFELGFNVRVVHSVRSLPEDELGPDAQRAMELLDTSRENEQQWQNLLDHFDFLRNREAMHRQLSASINSRVMSWTILEACLVITMAVLQVWYWKTFFEQRRFL